MIYIRLGEFVFFVLEFYVLIFFYFLRIDSDNSLKVIDIVNDDRKYDFSPIRAETLLFNKKLVYFSDLKYGKLGLVAGRRSYAYLGKLAKLARVLTNWTLRKLLNEYNFTPVVIPNLLHSDIIRACGFNPDGQRTQVYALENPPSPCLAGTAEMSLASLHIGENFSTEQELPKRYCALSRCYRAEAKSSGEMSGLYRVNYFDKVEMFGITEADGQHSDKMLEEFVSIQKALFTELGLHFRVVDMPPMDLGKPAYRKFDIESYMAGMFTLNIILLNSKRFSIGRDFWGEISSASNCTDYQSKRLNITYNKFYFDSKTEEIVDVKRCFVHTVNGTACAVPRMIISIVEQNQTNDGQVLIPKVLRPYMNGEKVL